MLFALAELLHSADAPRRFEQWLAEERPVSSMACFRSAVESLFGGAQSASGPAQPEAATIPPEAQVLELARTTKPAG